MKKAKLKAEPQLQLVPRSDNERARQSHWRKAVVSVRFSGTVIGQLDKLASEQNQREGRYRFNRVTRTDIIQRAVNELLARETAAPKKGKTK